MATGKTDKLQTWKLFRSPSTISLNSPITLPSDWQELYLMISVNGSADVYYEMQLLRLLGNRTYTTGRGDGTSYVAVVTSGTNAAKIHITGARVSGAEYSPKFGVWYKS